MMTFMGICILETNGQPPFHPKKQVKSILYEWLPKRLVDVLLFSYPFDRPINSVSQNQLKQITATFHEWQIKPGGTEGNRTAEITVVGGG
jgi:predicted flavoprotein YhiN